MNRCHAMGSGITYGRRYLLAMIFNLATVKDDDGNLAGKRLPEYVVEPPSRRLTRDIEERRAAVALARMLPQSDAPQPKSKLDKKLDRERSTGTSWEAKIRSEQRRPKRFRQPIQEGSHDATVPQFDERNPPADYDSGINPFLDRRPAR